MQLLQGAGTTTNARAILFVLLLSAGSPGCNESNPSAQPFAAGTGNTSGANTGTSGAAGGSSATTASGGSDSGTDATPMTVCAPTATNLDGGGLPPSCQPNAINMGLGLTDCGPNKESCCATELVTGGMFARSFDGVSCPGGPDASLPTDTNPGCFENMGFPATISDFRLDKYEITVGRFRQFVGAVIAGWTPTAGAGKHTHLNGGKGLSTDAGYETGWDPNALGAGLSNTAGGWDLELTELCNDPPGSMWTTDVGCNEAKPINCLDWYKAYAFCIWDGGFLPSEAEWNYAAAGGSQQRVYPWSTPPTSMSIDCAHANYGPGPSYTTSCVRSLNNAGSESPLGDGRWGQADLAGNVAEWVLDSAMISRLTNIATPLPYQIPCSDCALQQPYVTGQAIASSWIVRGGNWYQTADVQVVSNRNASQLPMNGIGARCARAP
jgi:formylglycine-generating enzyme required for sulfatase activity